MGNVLSREKRKHVIALGRLGWCLRRIEQATGVRRETAGDYLRSSGIVLRSPGCWGAKSLGNTGHFSDHRLFAPSGNSGAGWPAQAKQQKPGTDFLKQVVGIAPRNVTKQPIKNPHQDPHSFQPFPELNAEILVGPEIRNRRDLVEPGHGTSCITRILRAPSTLILPFPFQVRLGTKRIASSRLGGRSLPLPVIRSV
jgi:hypothetical protein